MGRQTKGYFIILFLFLLNTIYKEFNMEAKKWYTSKTVWVNALALVGMIAQTQTGFIFSEEMQIMLLSLINLGLRVITKEQITW
jgi:hypothetical protein